MNENQIAGEYTQDIDQIVAKSIELDQGKHPDLKNLKHCILHNDPRAYKVAKYWTIVDRKTGEIHHHGLTLETFSRTKKDGWQRKPESLITLEDQQVDEIQKLFDFVATVSHVEGDAEYMIIRQDNQRIGRIIEAIRKTAQRSNLVEKILSWVEQEPTATDGLIQLSVDNPTRSKSLVAALNYGRYKHALGEFQKLVNENRKETEYQDFLEKNHWMFGSEYSELFPYRDISNGVQVDFPLRRTLDGYLEVIEIKRPLTGTALFTGDRHLYPRSEVTEAIAQANNYLQIIERDNFKIQAEFHILVDKVRAKVIIGRTGDKNQQEALRLWNSNQKQVEVVTFDQLIAIGERILEILAAENQHLSEIFHGD